MVFRWVDGRFPGRDRGESLANHLLHLPTLIMGRFTVIFGGQTHVSVFQSFCLFSISAEHHRTRYLPSLLSFPIRRRGLCRRPTAAGSAFLASQEGLQGMPSLPKLALFPAPQCICCTIPRWTPRPPCDPSIGLPHPVGYVCGRLPRFTLFVLATSMLEVLTVLH